MAIEHARYSNRIITDPNILVGKPVVKGTRIPVELVLAHLAENPDLGGLFAAYPTLSVDDVKACLAYASRHVMPTASSNRSRAKLGKSKSDYDAFRSAAGAWREVDTDRLVADIYADRRESNRPSVSL
jgi:uncharacterized protein (DUF433 family)